MKKVTRGVSNLFSRRSRVYTTGSQSSSEGTLESLNELNLDTFDEDEAVAGEEEEDTVSRFVSTTSTSSNTLKKCAPQVDTEYRQAMLDLEKSLLDLGGSVVAVDSNETSSEFFSSENNNNNKNTNLRKKFQNKRSKSRKSHRHRSKYRDLNGLNKAIRDKLEIVEFDKTLPRKLQPKDRKKQSPTNNSNEVFNEKHKEKFTKRAHSNPTLERKNLLNSGESLSSLSNKHLFSLQRLGRFRKSVNNSNGSSDNTNSTSKPTTNTELRSQKEFNKVPVILVTDIGADIDDTLALFVLLGASDIFELVCVVTAVNDGIARGALTRGWLRALGVKDSQVEILPSNDNLPAACHTPDNFPRPVECNLGRVEDTPKRIVEICKNSYKRFGQRMILVGIAALTPIADAIQLDTNNFIRRSIKRVYLQGNVFVNSRSLGPENGQLLTSTKQKLFSDNTTYLAPNSLAYNFRNDMTSATTVLDYFQYTTPITFLGKFAAYKIGITKEDFNYLSSQSNFAKELSEKLAKPSLTYMAQRQMNNFRKGNPTLFHKLYDVPKIYHDDLENMSWFDDLPNSGICSHPYDPLLIMALVEDHLHLLQVGRRFSAVLSDTNLATAARQPWFTRNYCFIQQKQQSLSFHKTDNSDIVHNSNNNQNNNHKMDDQNLRVMHTVIGNSEKEHGIPDAEYLHFDLIDHIAKGLRRN